MSASIQFSRREFLKVLASGATVAVTVHGMPAAAWAAMVGDTAPLPDGMPAWAPEPGKAKWRIDGLPKVLGQKLYARDFKARDFKHWPQSGEYFAYAIRADRVDAVLAGLDLSMLPAGLRPKVVIDAAALAAKGMPAKAQGMLAPFFVQPGAAPSFYGQPVAILIFDGFNRWRRAVQLLQFNSKTIRWGAASPEKVSEYAGGTQLVRDDRSGFSYYATPDQEYEQRSAAMAQGVRDTVKNASWLKLSRRFHTQALDPMFMEPENGLAWYDPQREGGVLHMVIGTQSPGKDLAECASVYDCSRFKLARVDITTCYPGGGFGGRDAAYFPMYLAMAAAFCDKPLRWRLNRFEQFQTGLKRCDTDFSATLALEPNGKLRAVMADYVLNSGGERNFSPYVAHLACLSSNSCYDIPLAVAEGKVLQSRQVIGGSQRGFGGPQAFTAIETLLDEAAQTLKMDPFALRRINLLQRGSGRTLTGAPVFQDLQLNEIMDVLEQHPLWTQRLQRQAEKEREGLRYGVGFALSNQAYGTSMDGMFGAVALDEQGEVVVHTAYIDMGNGAATTLGLAPAWSLGRNANQVCMGEAAFFLGLGVHAPWYPPPNQPHACANGGQPARYAAPTSAVGDPRDLVLRRDGPAAACLGAFHNYHVVQYAAHALFLHSVLPAAHALWGRQPAPEHTRWQDGKLHADGLPALSMAALRQQMRAQNLPSFCVAHATFGVEFAHAHFPFHSGRRELPLDWLGFGSGQHDIQRLEREQLHNPPEHADRTGRNVYAPCGCLVAATVNPKTGEIKIDDVVSALSAGRLLSPEIVSGQSQGGVLMAIGNVLFEEAPLGPDGPGNGMWNLHQYRVPRMRDLPRQQLTTLPAPADENTARAIGEAVFCPTPPAILNALAMALNHRFSQTPITPQLVLEALK